MQELFASLFVSDFPVAVLTRGEADSLPTAVIEGAPPNQFVCSADEAAREAGVQLGMPLAAATARFAYSTGGYKNGGEELRILERDPAAEARARRDLLRLAENATPRYEDSAPGLVTLDFTGLREPHASARSLYDETERLGFTPQLGVSRNRFVALCAARTQPGLTHVYPGEEAGFLSVQGLDVLPIEPAEIETLTRWGVRTVGDLARFDENDLTARFGERGARLARLARGEESSVLDAYTAPPELEERQEFDWEVGELEPLAFALSCMLERLCLKLQGCNLAVARLETKLELLSGRLFARKIDLPYPLTDPRTLLKLVRLDLDAHPPGDAIVAARVAAAPTDRRRVQFALFAPATPSPEKLAVTLARLSSLVGVERVGAPVAPDTHKPGAAAVALFAPSHRDKGGCMQTRDRAVGVSPRSGFAREERVFRAFRPPWPAKVWTESREPAQLESLGVSGPVDSSDGPWRVSGEWWTPEGWQYEEWDVYVQGRMYRACLDRRSQEWFVTGAYD
jgi:protein ImuB